MTESIRDQIIEILDSNDPDGGVYAPEEVEDFWGVQADAILSSSLIRRIRAEAWSEGHGQCLANIAWPEERQGNPYRLDSEY